jgi:TonB family protein
MKRLWPFVVISLALNIAVWSGFALVFGQAGTSNRFSVTLSTRAPQKSTGPKAANNSNSHKRSSGQETTVARKKSSGTPSKSRQVAQAKQTIAFKPIRQKANSQRPIVRPIPQLQQPTKTHTAATNQIAIASSNLASPDINSSSPHQSASDNSTSASTKTNLSGSNTSRGGNELTSNSNNSNGESDNGNSQGNGGNENGDVPRLPVEPTPIPEPTATPTPIPTATPRPVPTATPKPEPTATPRPTATPKPEPTATPRPVPTATPRPEPTATPRPRGITRSAGIRRQVKPRIPEDLKTEEFRTSVGARVEISATGEVTGVTLRSSSGNSRVDELALSALRRWRWTPAMRDGEPIPSVQNIRFDFEVR